MSHLIASWESIYANSAVLRTVIGFAHIAGLVGGGGAAIVADRAALSIHRKLEPARLELLRSLHDTHRIVLAGLAALAMSGLLQFAADTQTFLHSKVFWVKMGLLALLLANGLLVMRAEQRALTGLERGWAMLRWSAAASLTLWILITLAGAALPNLG